MNFKNFLITLVICFSPLTLSYAGSLNPDEEITISVYEQINPAIVAIDADVDDGVSSGTGCVITSDGYILTGSHVIEGCTSVTVITSTGQNYKANVVAQMGKNKDLAILKINPKKPLQTIKFGDSETIKVGQKVLAIGNPFGFSGTLTTGIVSRIDYQNNKIQTDAAINPGNSGGPIVNINGEVIGISQPIYNPDNNQSNIGIGFAVPVNEARNLINIATKK